MRSFWTVLAPRETLTKIPEGRCAVRVVISALFLLLLSPPLWAQVNAAATDVPEVSQAEGAESADSAWSPALTEAFELWTQALERKPKLVSLGTLDVQVQADGGLESYLRNRLTLLGRKTVSNRQWRDYWAKQKELSEALLAAWTSSGEEALKKGLKDWSELAFAKTSNQDVYLQAIEKERDAIEERLEASLAKVGEEAQGKALKAPEPLSLADESPFKRRRQSIAELRYRIAQQEDKLAAAQIAKTHSERQTATQGIMAKALESDLALVKRERGIAEAQSLSGTALWRKVWSGLSESADSKVSRLSDEVALGEQRVRSLEVEKNLLASQITYRSKKKGELEARLEESTSISGWLVAIYATALSWLMLKGWQVALMLFFLWIAVRMALKAINLGTDAILRKVQDDNPDEESSSEKRAKTIAAVFKSVARIAVIAIGSLMALEMIGVNTGPILGSVAILGLAISFGSQSLVKDIVTGFFILLENHFAVGDLVTISGNTGTVEGITLRSTRIRQFNGTLHIIPNGQIASVANVTRDWSRAIVDVGVAYGSDFTAVERVIQESTQGFYDALQAEEKADPEEECVLQEAPILLGIVDLADSAVVLRIIVKVKGGEQWGVERQLKRRLMDALAEEGIEIPFPQRVVWNPNAA